MAWPNNFNSFWEAMYGPEHHHPPRGAGIDHARPPPPPELPLFMNPDFWNRWSQGPPGEGPWSHGPHGRHHSRGRHGWHNQWGGPDAPANEAPDSGSGSASASGSDNDEEVLPEYISDDEVAYAAAAAEVDGKKQDASGSKDKEKANSPDTMMQDDRDAADPPEEIPNDGDENRRHHKRGGRHGRHGGRGFGRRGYGGPGGFGPQRRHGGGRRGGPEHRGPPPFGPFGPFLGGMFGGPHRPHGGPHRPHGGPSARDAHHPPPPPFPPCMAGLFEGSGSAPDGEHHPSPPHFHGRRHGRRGHGHPRGPYPPPPPPPGGESQGPFDFRDMMGALANHPYAHNLRHFLERAQQSPTNNNNTGDREGTPDSDEMDATITPPLDLFDQPDKWILHIAMPGAKKEDIAVNWDAERSLLSVSGVVYRPGDEDFQKTLITGERRVGLFSREVRLPPVGTSLGEAGEASKEEVDSDGIVAKMEDGILVVTVAKVEKDWTDVKRVEIE